jgi:hypothetical protein
MRRMWDAAFPPANPPDWEAVAGYIGGNTPHVWTDAEWARQKARWRLPIFVRSHDGDPNADGAAAVAWLRRHGVQPGVCVTLDYETRVDAAYLRVFDRVVQQAGYLTLLYGSRRTVLQNPKPSGGYWDAEWTNVPHLNRGSAATQYGGDVTLGQPYDASLVADSTPLWDTQGDLTIMDAATKKYLDGQFAALRGERNIDLTDLIGKVEVTYNQVNLKAGEILNAVRTAPAVDAEAVAALVAGQLKVTGITTDPGGVVTVTFGPRAT